VPVKQHSDGNQPVEALHVVQGISAFVGGGPALGQMGVLLLAVSSSACGRQDGEEQADATVVHVASETGHALGVIGHEQIQADSE
jgi:hypothetical protein